MRLCRALFASAAIVATAAHTGFAQSTSAGLVVPQHQVNFDASFAGLNVGYAVRNSTRTSFGASVGIGGNWWNYVALAGRHFSESGGLSYETKDGRTDKALFELFRGTVFVRRHFEAGRQLDVGLKGSAFLHSDSSDDDPGGGLFIGANVTGMWWQWHKLRLGSELDIGGYSEGRPELGITVAPLLVRLSIP